MKNVTINVYADLSKTSFHHAYLTLYDEFNRDFPSTHFRPTLFVPISECLHITDGMRDFVEEIRHTEDTRWFLSYQFKDNRYEVVGEPC